MTVLALAAFSLWLIIFFLPWRPWLCGEGWDSNIPKKLPNLSDITVIIPARNEESIIKHTLTAVLSQGHQHQIILINDHSQDYTRAIAEGLQAPNLKIMESAPLPKGYTGKLWALEQGRRQAKTPYVVLLDADIHLAAGTLAGLRQKLQKERKDLVSLMAQPSLSSFAEKAIMPAFIYFFKLLYPFRLANTPHFKWVAAAAGGCIFTKSEVLEKIGGFAALQGALIDDCTLARKVKEAGYSTWLGLTHSAQSVRPVAGLKDLGNMIARTAFSQLRYSYALLLMAAALLGVAFIVPVMGLWEWPALSAKWSLAALLLMFATLIPTLRYYRLSPLWAILLPATAAFYLAMTLLSAWRYSRGEKVRWRGRVQVKR